VTRRAIIVGLLVLMAGAHLIPARAAAAPSGSVTWTVDHQKKTITALVRLQIYSGCSGNPMGDEEDQAGACVGEGSQVTQFLADKIKGSAERIWNQGYHFRCYRLKVIVDVKLAADRGSVDPDRLAIRIDPSAVRIRSFVNGESNAERWNSEDPRDRVDPSNGGDISTWTEDAQGHFSHTYAHELGHVLGLEDTYLDATDPVTGKTKSVPIVGAPHDLMNGGEGIDQKTVDLLIKRNSDRLTDKDGNSVDLNDLRCEPSFMASFRASQNEYGASNVSNSLAHTPCSRAPFTSSTTQRMTVDGDRAEVRAVEGGSAAGYVLVPAFDAMTVQGGMSGGGRAAGAVGLFDVPIAVDLFRTHSQPADGDIPPVLDLPDDACPGGDSPGPTQRPDCGHRDYRAWLALKQDGLDLWPVPSSLPVTLRDIGYSQPRLDKLYNQCPGPWPWPGTVGEEPHAVKHPGRLPTFAALQQVYDDWVGQGKPGRFEITGTADVDWVEAGDYQKSDFTWELKLCPIDNEGVVAPGCS
jgi:hypothetical protein